MCTCKIHLLTILRDNRTKKKYNIVTTQGKAFEKKIYNCVWIIFTQKR